MNVLRTLESRIAGLVEGSFGRIFRSEVRPIELARKLVREMDDNRTVSLSRTYVPNEYLIWLSPEDRERYEGIEADVIDELCAYLLEHARREGLMFASGPSVSFHTDRALALGEFGIETRVANTAGEEGEPEEEPLRSGGRTMIHSSSSHGRERSGAPGRAAARALLVLDDRHLLVPATGALIGRSRSCDIVIDDGAISRRHAEVLPTPEGWLLRDLQSTNGVRVNGRRVEGQVVLQGGDVIEIGSTEVLFELR